MGFGSRRSQDSVSSAVPSASSYCREFCTRIDTRIPNVLHSTFNRDGSSGDFLRSFVQRYDKAKSNERKAMLEALLSYIDENFAPRAQGSSFEVFQKSRLHQGWQEVGLLILLRMVAHLTVTLPHMQISDSKRVMEMTHLQVRVIKTFLSLHEKVFADAFFESGASFLFLKILSPADFTIGDDLRSLVLDSFLLIARHGRAYKEALCDSDLLTVVEDSMEDTLEWETLPKFCDLVCEIFRGNPRYQPRVLSVLGTWLDSSAQRVCSIALRAAVLALNTLISEAPHNCHLRDEIWTHKIFQKLIALLDGEQRLCSDIVNLLCRFVKTLPDSSRHLFDFCRDQMMSEHEMEQMSFRLERDAYLRTDMETDTWISPETPIKTSAFGGRIPGVSDLAIRHSDAKDSEPHIVIRWSLIIFLCKHHEVFCEELVEEYGLTELLLLNVCDLAKPLLQQAALENLHILRLSSPNADGRVMTILADPEIFDALSLEELMRNATPAAMRQARFNLRSRRLKAGVFSAVEFLVHTDIIKSEIDDLMGEEVQEAEEDKGTGAFFMTETEEQGPGDVDAPQGARALRPKSDVPIPFHALHEYRLALPPVDEMPHCRALPMLTDPIETQLSARCFPSLRKNAASFPMPLDTLPSIDLFDEQDEMVPSVKCRDMELSVCVGATMDGLKTTLASQYASIGMETTRISGPMESWDDPSMFSQEMSVDLPNHTVCRTGAKTTEVLLPPVEDRNGPLTRKVLCVIASSKDCCGCPPTSCEGHGDLYNSMSNDGMNENFPSASIDELRDDSQHAKVSDYLKENVRPCGVQLSNYEGLKESMRPGIKVSRLCEGAKETLRPGRAVKVSKLCGDIVPTAPVTGPRFVSRHRTLLPKGGGAGYTPRKKPVVGY